MKVLTDANAIRETLQDLEPYRVAVAYVGLGWKKFIPASHLREIVLSPTLGTNPKAVEELMRELGDENVHFLDRLHAKFYIGAKGTLMGSCNLSDGGMGDDGHLEAAVVLREVVAMERLNEQFEYYRKLAQKGRYSTRKQKMDCLRNLLKMMNKAQASELANSRPTGPSITNYASELDRIHVTWYQSIGDDLDEERLGEVIPKVVEFGAERYFADWTQFREDDDVRPGDWLLCWRCNDDGMPRRRGDVSWLYVHDVVPDAFVVSDALGSNEYPKLAGEAAAEFLKRPEEPFELDPATKAAIREVLASGEFPVLLSKDEKPWSLKPADATTPAFLAAVKKKIVRR